jgi:hypothetical protein
MGNSAIPAASVTKGLQPDERHREEVLGTDGAEAAR